MSEQAGEKTEQPSQRKLEDALKKGQIARSPEVQTAFVLLGGLCALFFTGSSMWQQLAGVFTGTLGHLHDIPISASELSGYGVTGALWFAKCVGPIVITVVLAGLLAGGIQNRFNTAPEAVGFHWEKIDPMAGFRRVFSGKSAIPTAMAACKLTFIFLLSWSQIRAVLNDPIFSNAVSLDRIADFMAGAGWKISLRIVLVLGVLASLDYGYQWWRMQRDLMMTKQEVKEEMKSSEGNPQIKAARRRRRATSQRKMLAEVPNADVVLVNPTHIAIALRYDRKTMKAPKIVAKGIRLNAQRIREMAEKHQIPIMENKPLARLMFKYGKVGGEIPAQLYAAVAEVLAWVYRVNRYRYYTQENGASVIRQ
ncbi:MAG TPA: EscU/YscU/HrcU family type III secretion system export apparatus switch protein [Candidatus Acidoferrum sp.]|nr:EscU/YscU/HrcU family type III secretion system export apparatus switch protein [Candidatus Acidoferrum sp.]